MKSLISVIALLLALSVSNGVMAKQKKMEQVTPTTNVVSETVDLVAKVKSINSSDRHVVLEGPNGNLVTVKVSNEVKNFKEIKKGDDVMVKYNESVVWSILKKGEKEDPTKSLTTSTSTAAPGQKPALDKSETVNLVATIQAIDKNIPNVTLKGPEGNTVTFKVKNPQNLEGVKVGDQVAINYTESIAVSVEKAPKKN